MSARVIHFLSLNRVLELHEDQIARYGGDASVRDHGLLQSAIEMPRSSFGGQWLHEFPQGMAAAYLFHIVQNHPFVDGNKRTGLAAAIAFLGINDFDLDVSPTELQDFVLGVARGDIAKEAVVEFCRSRIVKL